MNRTILLTGLLIAAFVLSGCAPRIQPNPLLGWKDLGVESVVGCPFGEVVCEDYRAYVRAMARHEQNLVIDHNVEFYTKQELRAVEILIHTKGIKWKHVLIYDRDNKRVSAMKYAGGTYRS
jgi:hypothetical protein